MIFLHPQPRAVHATCATSTQRTPRAAHRAAQSRRGGAVVHHVDQPRSAPECRRRRSRRFRWRARAPRSAAPVSATTCGCSFQSAATAGTRCSCHSRCPPTSLTTSIHRCIEYLRPRRSNPEKNEACRQGARRARRLPPARRASGASTPTQPRAAACAQMCRVARARAWRVGHVGAARRSTRR